jgi:hypothetical protein
MVNGRFPDVICYGFEMVDAAARRRISHPRAAINRIFTSNRFGPIFSEFSASLPQGKYFRFIHACYVRSQGGIDRI